MELTPEQMQAAESMSLDELRALAIAEVEAPVEKKEEQPRDAEGKFVAPDADQIDNSADEDPDLDPPKTIYRKEIPNGDGSVDVYESESLEELVEKLAVGKLNANKKIQEFISEKKAATAQNEQILQDDEFVIQQKLKDNPKATIKQVVAEVIEERLQKAQRSDAIQNEFVATHPDYLADPANGTRLTAWLKTNGYTEITKDGLEKAYQDLKHSGLLKLKTEGANDVASVETKEVDQTGQAKADTTQQRSQRKGSGVSARSSSRAMTVPNTQPTEDELYSMPIEKLKELADKQLRDSNNR